MLQNSKERVAFLCNRSIYESSLKQALLFFDKVVVKGDYDEKAYAQAQSIDTVAWLLDNGLLELIDHCDYMSEGVYNLQDEILGRICDSAIDTSSIFEPSRWGVIRGQDINLNIAPNASIASTLVNQLRGRGFAYLPGDRFRSDEYRSLTVNDYDKNGNLVVRSDFPRVSQFSEPSDGFREELRFRDSGTFDREIVLLHPALVALHDGIVRCCAPMVGAQRGEVWYPTGELGVRDLTPLATALAVVSPASIMKARIGRVISSDLEMFSVDLENANFPDIVGFRNANRALLDKYFDSVFDFVHGVSLSSDYPDDVIGSGLQLRAIELKEQANDIRRNALRRFGITGASLVIGVSGFSWFIRAGDPASAIFALLPSLFPLAGDGTNRKSAATYLTKLTDDYGTTRR